MQRAIRVVACAVFLGSIAIQTGHALQEPQDAVRLDFQNVELSVVLSALADAGNLNVVYTDLPSSRVTLRMNQPVPRSEILPLLRSIAESNGLTVIDDGALLRVELSDTRDVDPETEDVAATDELPPAAAGPQFFVYPLKHTRASTLAGTIEAIFGRGEGMPVRQTSRPDAQGRSLSQQLRNQRIPPIQPDRPPDVAVELGPQQQPRLTAQLGGDVSIVPDEPTNVLIVRAEPADWEVIRQLIDALDQRPLQVLIEVVIAEVRRTDDLQAGFTGEVTREREGAEGTSIAGSLGGFTTGEFALELMRLGRADVTAMVSALATKGNVKVLSRPVVLAQNNQEARISVGAERPFIQVFRSLPTEAAVRDQVVQYRDVGTSLTILPTINADGYVNLSVTQEVSVATAEEQFGAPVISTREAATQLFVKDGQTIVIGGLIDQQEERTRTGVPLLMDVPLIGLLFSSIERTTSESELFIFLTPHIVATDGDVDRVRDGIERGTNLIPAIPLVKPDSIPGGR